MVLSCVFCGSKQGTKGRTCHKFPLDNFALLEKWIAAIGLKHFIPNETSLLCNDHFDEKCFQSSGFGLVLKANAVPTLFSSDSKGTPIKMQKNINNLSNKVYDIKGNQLITQQPNTKYISSTYSTSSKIQRNDGPSISIPIHSMRETVMDYSSVEHCDENVTPSTSLAAEKGNNPVRNKIPETCRGIKSRILHMKHDHQYATSPQMMKMQFLMQQRHILKRHVLRLRKKIISLKDNIAK
ncbi:uncharacterized protein LOC116850649 isoform X2 [Odontomachus brunneus]|uniref:uncharacterized protein LOC116850649 isoform X2 n=1 Tax=Odontomachus brunneus TaxID=486640 RepID=UPI0013F28712|nr:uncharacterized protein LOC116850649 isoform X2 [Odontomachus brunneus]